VGFRIRKSISIAPGVRMNFSKTGIGFSAGVKGYRVTKQADGRIRRTASLPGTGLSYVTSSGGGRHASRPRVPATAAPKAKKPGLFAPKGEKQLYRALRETDAAAMVRIAQQRPKYALAASSIAGLLEFAAGHVAAARVQLTAAFANGADPSADPFIEKYVHVQISVHIAPGVRAELGLDRSAVGLALAELHQAEGDLQGAVNIVEELEPTTYAALSLAELYCELGRDAEVVALTDGTTNTDDTTALLCVFRGIGLREQGYFEAARAVFKEALKSEQRNAIIRHRARLERARTYEAEGKRASARKDLERVMAEDSTYEGLAEALRELGDETAT
jgi:tetratricopeptide (TPR) repeat protein